jgi:ferredoxin--NADP+ reductase
MKDLKYIRGFVTSRREVTPDLWIIRIRPAERIVFLPGQYVTVALPGSTKMVERPYSVASSPAEPELEFFIERVPSGVLTPELYKVPLEGEIYLRRAAKGRFLFDGESVHPNHFMVATVTGVSPYVSMIRDLVARDKHKGQIGQRFVVIQAASLSSELGYHDELSAYALEHSWFRYVPTISRSWLDPAWPSEKGRAEDIVRKYLDASGFLSTNTTAYLCGNPNMIRNVKGVLRRAGFSEESVAEEMYWRAH